MFRGRQPSVTSPVKTRSHSRRASAFCASASAGSTSSAHGSVHVEVGEERLPGSGENLFLQSYELLKTWLQPFPDHQTSTFQTLLSRFRTSDSPSIGGYACSADFFDDLLLPHHWVSSLHMDLLVSASWAQYGAFLRTRRIVFHSSLFASVLLSTHMSVSRLSGLEDVRSHPLLLRCVNGDGSSESGSQRWFDDVDLAYMPMNWGGKHWVGLCIDLVSFHVSILDSFQSLNASRKVANYMKPFLDSLWQLLLSVRGTSGVLRGRSGFTFSRLGRLPQNLNGGDCGPIAMKFIEAHSHGVLDVLPLDWEPIIASVRLRYAVLLHKQFGESG